MDHALGPRGHEEWTPQRSNWIEDGLKKKFNHNIRGAIQSEQIIDRKKDLVPFHMNKTTFYVDPRYRQTGQQAKESPQHLQFSVWFSTNLPKIPILPHRIERKDKSP